MPPTGDNVAQSILDTLMSPNELDRNLEPANVVDGLYFIGRALQRVAKTLEGGGGAARERARIRAELLAWTARERRGEDGSDAAVVEADDLAAALDRICPEEG